MDSHGWKDAKRQLGVYYVEFYVQCKIVQRVKLRDVQYMTDSIAIDKHANVLEKKLEQIMMQK